MEEGNRCIVLDLKAHGRIEKVEDNMYCVILDKPFEGARSFIVSKSSVLVVHEK